ncbi:sugar phosphate isomerase/epimerase family protein [Bordetella bronchiseptica]|uniref:sugar phosphate isomerase/epimerase family protein n=1 Tax=Bordetella bronchiseptica TaxID=518 RepID=UPI000528979A|nr:TIM barrel protein [Bordetella bronchiseptica]
MQTDRPPLYAVNHYLCPADTPLPVFAARVAQAGFGGIGLTAAALDEMPLPAIASLLDGLGLRVSSINTAGFFRGGGADQAGRNLRLLEAAAALDAAALNVIVGADDESVPLQQARQAVAQALQGFGAQARAAGVRLAIEPLNLSNVFSKSCVNTIAQVEALRDTFGEATINVDYFHLWADPDLPRLLDGQGVPIGLTQWCDVTWTGHPGQARRAPLGAGRLSADGYLDGLAVGCPVELELFIDQLPGMDYARIIDDSARHLGLKGE